MEIRHLSFAYGREKILNSISLKIKRGKITTLMGANGCGKSTLLNLCSGNLKISTGKVLVNGKDVRAYKHKEFAKELGMVHQQNRILGDISVKKLISYGRTPYIKPLRQYSDEDEREVEEALKITELEDFADFEVRKLSGGQRQRVFLAMVLAQKSRILLLDEPTTYLDIKYQFETLNLIRRINSEFGTTIVMVLHDIMQAINYSDEVVGLSAGRIAFQGSPKTVLNDEVISDLYQTELTMNVFKGSCIVLPKNSIHGDI